MKKKLIIVLSISIYIAALLGYAGYKLGKNDPNYAGYKKHIEDTKNSLKANAASQVNASISKEDENKNTVSTTQNTNTSSTSNGAASVTEKQEKTSRGTFTKVLKKGDNGEEVKLLQTLLKEKGFFKNNVTGTMGNATVNALKAFEKSIKVTEDGVLDTKTASKLLE